MSILYKAALSIKGRVLAKQRDPALPDSNSGLVHIDFAALGHSFLPEGNSDTRNVCSCDRSCSVREIYAFPGIFEAEMQEDCSSATTSQTQS